MRALFEVGEVGHQSLELFLLEELSEKDFFNKHCLSEYSREHVYSMNGLPCTGTPALED